MNIRDYPVNLQMDGKRVLVVGGGRVAHRKLRRLLDYPCKIRLVSPRVEKGIEALLREPELDIVHVRRQFVPDDVRHAFLVFAATDDPAVNRNIGRAVGPQGLVNVATDRNLSTFTLPAVMRRGRFSISISTGGASPSLAKQTKDELSQIFGHEYVLYLDLLSELREYVQERVDDGDLRRAVFRKIGTSQWVMRFAEHRERTLNQLQIVLESELGLDMSGFFGRHGSEADLSGNAGK